MGLFRCHQEEIPVLLLVHAPQVFYFVWGNCLVAFGFVLSTFFRVVKTAVVFGYLYTIGSGAPGNISL